IPFRYQGQYEDVEIGLYYNRFRYYSPTEVMYTQKDPIGLSGNNPTLYGYVYDTNIQIDPFGLILKPEPGYLRGKRHGLKLSDKDAQITSNNDKLPHGKWGNKKDLAYAGELADTLEPGGFKDFPVNPDSKSVVFHPNGDSNAPKAHPPTHYRLRNNGNGTFHGFPIDHTAEEIRNDSHAKVKCH
ncbi:RHS repeat-associated core domain-containing protein, partial [Lysinibacillus sphaericus]|uniref:RHS repeat-associated core domain-containing protein n=3 Tax=Lysinibacillus TaxID=400634 RepID=UPI0018AFF16A